MVFTLRLGVVFLALLASFVASSVVNQKDIVKDDQSVEKIAALESDLSALKTQLATLIDSLQSRQARETASSEPGSESRRVSRSITGDTFSGFFGHIDGAAYGNCTCRGDPGPPGPPGLPGRDGRDGRDAPILCQVPSPETRSATSGPDQGQVPTESSDAAPAVPWGGVYVRWGRSVCPDDSELVYEGVVGGSFYDHSGGGANYQCLPLEPIYDDDLVTPGTQDPRAFIYGAEYQVSSLSDPAWTQSVVNDHGPPCAVCLASRRPTVLMIPARNVCPSSLWTLEYSGLLMAARHTHKRSEYICVDRNPQSIPRTSQNVNGALLYIVESQCGSGNSMPCGPYIDGHEVTCAVCSLG